MAIFVTRARLLESVRLPDDVNSQALQIFSNCEALAAAKIFTAAGKSGIDRYLAVSSVNPPTSTDEAYRLLLEDAEISLVKAQILRRLPTLRQDASAVTMEAWNEEVLSRMSQKDAEDLASKLEEQALTNLGIVFPDTELGSAVFTVDNPNRESVYRFNEPYRRTTGVYGVSY